MKIIKGMSVSKGIAFGNIYFISESPIEFTAKAITDTDREIERFNHASADAFNFLQSLYEKTLHTVGEENAQIFSIQQMMMQDNDYVGSVMRIITQEKMCAEYAVDRVAERFAASFLEMDEEMMRSKAYDIVDISNHIKYFLKENGSKVVLPIMKNAMDKIVVADCYVPSHIVDLNYAGASAIIAFEGMKKSHASFLVRRFELPAVINVGDIDEEYNGHFAAVNGFTGELIIDPDDATLKRLKKQQIRYNDVKDFIHKIYEKKSLLKSRKAVKLIALDLDGTIISHSTNYSDKVIETINSASTQGVNVVVCTGRVLGEIPEDIRKISGIKYFITSNGSSIVNHNSELLYTDTIEKYTARQIFDILADYKVLIDLYIGGKGYMQKSDSLILDEYNVRDGFENVLLTSREMKDDIMAFYNETEPKLEKINLFFADKKERSEAIYRISRLDPAPKIAYSMDYNLEITSSTCCKGQGLQFLANLLNISMSEVMAVGDSNNDISMLKLAGIPVAMGNSPETVKQAAVFITDTCENDGAVQAIRKYAIR